MLDRSITSAAREALRGLSARLIGKAALPDASLPVIDTRPAPMRPLLPPAAVNDNPLAALEAEVERDLRNGGYLR